MATVPEPTKEVMANHGDNNNDLLFEADGPKEMKCCTQNLDLGSLGDGRIQLQISHQLCNKSSGQMVSVIVAKEKLMKNPPSQAFCDDDPKSIFSSIFEEEPIILEKCADGFLCDAAPVQSVDCKLQDKDEKALVLAGPHELKALHLLTGDLKREVVFCMSFVQGDDSDDKIPVTLGLKGNKLYLSCVMKGDTPTLQLEEVDPKSYPKRDMEKQFVFYKTEIKNRVEFESALYPNWYISTSQAEQKPVFLGNSKGHHGIIDFTMEVLSP